MVAFQKRWPVMRGKTNMISEEWYMENNQLFCNFSETFLAFPEGFHCTSLQQLSKSHEYLLVWYCPLGSSSLACKYHMLHTLPICKIVLQQTLQDLSPGEPALWYPRLRCACQTVWWNAWATRSLSVPPHRVAIPPSKYACQSPTPLTTFWPDQSRPSGTPRGRSSSERCQHHSLALPDKQKERKQICQQQYAVCHINICIKKQILSTIAFSRCHEDFCGFMQSFYSYNSGWFTGIGAIIWLFQCLWTDPGGYG